MDNLFIGLIFNIWIMHQFSERRQMIFLTNASTNKTAVKKLAHILARTVIKCRLKKVMQPLTTVQGSFSKPVEVSRPVLALIAKCIIFFLQPYKISNQISSGNSVSCQEK